MGGLLGLWAKSGQGGATGILPHPPPQDRQRREVYLVARSPLWYICCACSRLCSTASKLLLQWLSARSFPDSWGRAFSLTDPRTGTRQGGLPSSP
jgi:hypothetical protein